ETTENMGKGQTSYGKRLTTMAEVAQQTLDICNMEAPSDRLKAIFTHPQQRQEATEAG
ncbi:hypothetical protein BGZ54_001697, partial [Gamsiella multidivaricata]